VDGGALQTRDESLPAEYAEDLANLSMAPLWAGLHLLLPPERSGRMRKKAHPARPSAGG